MKNHRRGLPYGWRREASKEFVRLDTVLSGHTYLVLIFNSFLPVTYPSFLQFSLTPSSLGRGQSVQTPMRTFMIIEVYGRFYCCFDLRDSTELHVFKKLILNSVVYSFGNSVDIQIYTY